MNKTIKLASLYLATLKAAIIIHQQSHWLASGKDSYEDHLLYERIYNESQECLDTGAEKFISIFGNDCLEYKLQNSLLLKALSNYNDFDNFNKSLRIEKDFLKFNQLFYNHVKSQSDKMTLGLDDFIMETHSKHEGFVYLLEQKIK